MAWPDSDCLSALSACVPLEHAACCSSRNYLKHFVSVYQSLLTWQQYLPLRHNYSSTFVFYDTVKVPPRAVDAWLGSRAPDLTLPTSSTGIASPSWGARRTWKYQFCLLIPRGLSSDLRTAERTSQPHDIAANPSELADHS